MVVRGDGALVSAAFARGRPIETILSGPAASLVGARHLTGLEDAVVSDIGGTTTDVAVLDHGRPRLDPQGATVGGFRTMVEAVAMRTFGLGGDSEVGLEDGGLEPRLTLGPRRLVPLALAAAGHAEAVIGVLERQGRAPHPGRLDGRFAMRTGVPERLAAGLSGPEARLFARSPMRRGRSTGCWSPTAQNATLNRLVARGLVHIVGFTPSDAAHVLGKQATWNREAAELGAALFARKRDARGLPLAAGGAELAGRVLTTLTRTSAEVILETAFAEDGLDGAATVAHALVQRAVDASPGIARLSSPSTARSSASAPRRRSTMLPCSISGQQLHRAGGHRCRQRRRCPWSARCASGPKPASASPRRACSGFPQALRCAISPPKAKPWPPPKLPCAISPPPPPPPPAPTHWRSSCSAR
jgi:N-methylhydantoinase A/oxoprolinase/acetone carboxylase beta subunit